MSSYIGDGRLGGLLTRYELFLEKKDSTDSRSVRKFRFLSDAIKAIMDMENIGKDEDCGLCEVARVKDSNFCFQIVYEYEFKKHEVM